MSQKTFLCRCEDVTVEEFRAAYREGFTELESLKRYTGVATGFCQGKGCLCESAQELARLRNVPPGVIRPTTIRPPAEPLTFTMLASLPVPQGSATAGPASTEPPAEPPAAPAELPFGPGNESAGQAPSDSPAEEPHEPNDDPTPEEDRP